MGKFQKRARGRAGFRPRGRAARGESRTGRAPQKIFRRFLPHMPTYEYRCEKCQKTFEAVQSMKDERFTICPESLCQMEGGWGRGEVKRLLGTGAGLIFKGSGFYITDYRSEGYKEAAKKEAGGAEKKAAPSESGGGEKTKTPAAAPAASTPAGGGSGASPAPKASGAAPSSASSAPKKAD